MNLFQKLSSLLLPDPPPDAVVAQAIEHIVQVVDPALRMAGGLEHRLEPAVKAALDYCAGLTARLPEPLEVNTGVFATDPLVHAFFASNEDIESMLGRSEAVREFLSDGSNAFATECYALLGMRRQTKTVMGTALHGEMLQADAPRQLLYFTDHTLRELTHSEADTRARLNVVAFDSLIQSFADAQKEKRAKRDELRIALEMERATGGGSLVPTEKDWRVSSLMESYRTATESLAPDRVADDLAAWLETSSSRLYLQDCSVAVDSLGVIAPEGVEDEGYHQIRCPELVGRDRRRWIVTLVRISCPEARDAVESQKRKEAATRSLWI